MRNQASAPERLSRKRWRRWFVLCLVLGLWLVRAVAAYVVALPGQDRRLSRWSESDRSSIDGERRVARTRDHILTVGDLSAAGKALRWTATQPMQMRAARVALLYDAEHWWLQRRHSITSTSSLEAADAAWRWSLAQVALRDLERFWARPRDVSQGELRRLWPEIRADLATPERVRLRQIFVRLPRHAQDEGDPRSKARDRAMEVWRRLESGEGFASLASEHSESTTALRDGLVGWVDADKLPSMVQRAVREMNAASHSPPIEVTSGFVIVQLLDHQPAHEPSFEESESRLRRAILQRERAQRRAWLASAKLQPLQDSDDAGHSMMLPSWEVHFEGVAELPALRMPYDVAMVQAGFAQALKNSEATAQQLVTKVLAGAAAARHFELTEWQDGGDRRVWERRRFLHRQRLGAALAKAGDGSEPTEVEVWEEYRANRERWVRVLPQLRLRVLEYSLANATSRRSVDRFLEVAASLQRGSASWREAVDALAEDPAFGQRELGWRDRQSAFSLGESFDSLFEPVAPAGYVSEVRQEQSTLLVIQVFAAQSAGSLAFSEAREEITRSLRVQKRAARRTELAESWLDEMAFELLSEETKG